MNVLKVSVVQSNQTQPTNEGPIKLSAICMSPVELPYVPILLNDTFMKALWDTGAEKSYLSEKTSKIFFYKQVKKSRTQKFEIPWLFHVLADLEYPCILGVDFISTSKIILDFHRKSLSISDSQIDTVFQTIEEGKVEIDLSNTRLELKQKQELLDLFSGFQGLFPDKPGLTHVLYHEIDAEDKPPVVSRPYRYARIKQVILDYHVDKMLNEGAIIPIQFLYASPVVLCRKNNGLQPDNPEAHRFAVEYRKLNVITKYPRYPLPLTDDLIMNITHTTMMSALDSDQGTFNWQ
ncbi:retrovirus-related Pol polyprotein from transposon 297 [Trichonephila clavipes]|nr:retrovirus-related Pol polyprotein from transposon 297 [Trichonephila clavipes]